METNSTLVLLHSKRKTKKTSLVSPFPSASSDHASLNTYESLVVTYRTHR